MLPRIQYISQGKNHSEHISNIHRVLDAGIIWIQLRVKTGTPEEILRTAEKVKDLCIQYQALFIVNDYPSLANQCNADGVHLGLHDMKVEEARAILGNKIIGGTANTFDDIETRITEGCQYIGVGPYRYTSTKEKLSPILGLHGYQKYIAQLNEKSISIPPLFAIGGILPEDVKPLLEVGVYGIAVSGILTHANPSKMVVSLKNQISEYADYSE